MADLIEHQDSRLRCVLMDASTAGDFGGLPPSGLAQLAGLWNARSMLNRPKRLIKKLARRIAGPGEIAGYHHRFDQMATKHNDSFRNDPVFASAYARAVEAGGWDYGIPYRIHQALWCAAQGRKVEGAVVELGTGRGFIMSAVLKAWPDWEASGRSMFLFDTFESGWVEADASRSNNSRYYATSFEDVLQNFTEWPRVSLIQGDVFKTLPAQQLGQIAFLHIDLNHQDPEVFGLRHLWDRIPSGGVVLLDDYAYRGRQAQYEAMNAAAKDLGVSILSTASGQGIIVK